MSEPKPSTQLTTGQKFALLVGLVLLALAVVFFLNLIGPSTVNVGCSDTTPTATPAASPAPAATPSASASTATGEGCLFGMKFNATGIAGMFIVILLILLLVWKQLQIAALKVLGSFSSFGPYASR